MSNLFSIFDPQSWLSLNLNWISATFALILIPPFFWVTTNQSIKLLSSVASSLMKEFKAVINTSSVPGFLLLSLAFFCFICLNNALGLLPFMFTASSHLSFTLSLALPFWVGHMLLAIYKTPNFVLAHLVPLNTPSALMPFMVIIELVSSFIRPITLSVRLAANMVAGHLLLTLMASNFSNSLLAFFSLTFFGLILLGILECCVSLIQAYVFSILSTLYLNEVNHFNLS